MNCSRVFALGSLIYLCLGVHVSEAETRRVLHVSLYPFIPDASAAALTLKQGFEHLHPDVVVDISLNAHYYSPDPKDKGVLYEDADVHEIDSIFLQDFIERHRLQPLATEGLDAFTKVAMTAATRDGTVWGAPQWMCTDFLVYRASTGILGDGPSLETVISTLRSSGGLLLDMRDTGQLGELYLSALIASSDGNQAALQHLTATPDPTIVVRLKRILAAEPSGLGRNPAYAEITGFYARQFSRGVGGAFVGYSELTRAALDESTQGCRIEDHCVQPSEIHVAPFPFADGQVKPIVWVDFFAIDRKVHGQSLQDARNFIYYATSLPAYRALLIPPPGSNPRYLLPATEAAFHDEQIIHAAPLYPAFRSIVERGVTVSAPDLNRKLHDVATKIDAALVRER